MKTKQKKAKRNGILVLSMVAVLLACLLGCQLDNITQQELTSQSTDSGITFIDEGQFYRVFGDILLDKNDPGHREYIKVLKGEKSADASKLTYSTFNAWPRGYVPYYFDAASNWTSTEKQHAKNAMAAYSKVCDVRFAEQGSAGDYVLKLIKQDSDSVAAGSSTLGYTKSAHIVVKPKWISSEQVIMHELGHTLGFQHEHQRSDRDNYITINTKNLHMENLTIKSAFEINKSFTTSFASYDVRSIMHYKPYSTSLDVVYDLNQPMIIGKNGVTLVENKVLSSKDISGLVSKYGPVDTLKYSSVYDKNSVSAPIVKGLTETSFVNDYKNTRYPNNYRLSSIETYLQNGSIRYTGYYKSGTASELLRTSLTKSGLVSVYNNLYSQGYRIKIISSCVSGSTPYYAAVFEKSSTGETCKLGLTRSDVVSTTNTYYSNGYRVQDIDTYSLNGQVYYNVVYRKSTVSESARYGKTYSEIKDEIATKKSSGYIVYKLSLTQVNGTNYYTAIFRKGDTSQKVYIGQRTKDFDYTRSQLHSQGYRIQALGVVLK